MSLDLNTRQNSLGIQIIQLLEHLHSGRMFITLNTGLVRFQVTYAKNFSAIPC